MNKPKVFGLIFVLAGIVLLVAALSLFVFNKQESNTAGYEADQILLELREKDTDIVMIDDENGKKSIATVEAKGFLCMGYLTIPGLSLELPIIAQWSYEALEHAPCREYGSLGSDNLVIAGHNFESHFGSLPSLGIGQSVFITTVEDERYEFVLADMHECKPDEVLAVVESGYPLVIYTCTYSGQSRHVLYFSHAKS